MKFTTHKDNLYIDTEREPNNPRKSLRWQDRDTQILETMYSFGGMMSKKQIWQLFWHGRSIQAVKVRMSKLFHNGYVERTTREGTIHFRHQLYWLSEQGASVVAGLYGEPVQMLNYVKKPNWDTVWHDVGCNDFVIHVIQAIELFDEFEMVEWSNERELRANPIQVHFSNKGGQVTKRGVVPDSYLSIRRYSGDPEPFVSRLFLEIDKSSHPTPRFMTNKIYAGSAFLVSKELKRRFGIDDDGSVGRWLVIVESMVRLRNLITLTEQVAGKYAWMWNYACVSDLSPETVFTEAVWWKPGKRHPVALFPPR